MTDTLVGRLLGSSSQGSEIRISSQHPKSRLSPTIYNGRLPRPIFSLHYAFAVLAILPHTSVLKLALFPILLWQGWNSAVGLDISVVLANSLGLEYSARLHHYNLSLVGWLFVLVPRPVDWAFTKKLLRRYDPPAEGQHATPVERPLYITNVLLSALNWLVMVIQAIPRTS